MDIRLLKKWRTIANKLFFKDLSIEFDKAWDGLSEKEQHDIVLNNTDLLSDSELISELESRGYLIKEDE